MTATRRGAELEKPAATFGCRRESRGASLTQKTFVDSLRRCVPPDGRLDEFQRNFATQDIVNSEIGYPHSAVAEFE